MVAGIRPGVFGERHGISGQEPDNHDRNPTDISLARQVSSSSRNRVFRGRKERLKYSRPGRIATRGPRRLLYWRKRHSILDFARAIKALGPVFWNYFGWSGFPGQAVLER